MIYKDIIQGSEEWFDIKRGKLTATHINDILPSKRGYKEARNKLMLILAREITTGITIHKRTSKSMDDGLLKEPEARAAYEAWSGYIVEEVGFIDHPTIENFGCSPDGLIDAGLGMEIKCPEPEAHFDIVVNGIKAIKKEYIIQMNVNMMCYECDRWHYVDYDPRLPDDLALVIIAVDRDKTLCTEIEKEVKKFQAELKEMLNKIKKL